MRERKKAEERKSEMLAALTELHARSKTQAEFAPKVVAVALGVSVVWLYNKVGTEYRNMRSTLPGLRKTREATIGDLVNQVASLRKENQELKEKLKGAAFQEIAEAVVLIESLDGENRMLRAEVKMLRERLAESEIMFMPNYDSSLYQIKRQSMI